MDDASTLVHLLARSAAARPDAEALVADGVALTYAALWAQVERACESLRQEGLASGDHVALILPNSPAYVVWFYAILASGAVVVPINPDAATAELINRLQHSGATAAILDRSRLARPSLEAVADSGIDIVNSDAVMADSAAGQQPTAIDLPAIDAGDLAAIFYTSGTTAEPRGVMLSHRNLVSNTLAISEALALRPSDRVLAALPFFYAYGNSVLHTHLAAGATVVIEQSLMYPQRVVDTMRAQQITGFPGVPSMFTSLVERSSFGAGASALPRLRYVTQAGAAMRLSDIARVRARFPNVAFHVMYGQTEATARLTMLPPRDIDHRPGSAGLPIRGVRLRVMASEDREARPGETGDVQVSGPGVMLGYWRAPAATASVMTDNGLERWLRTGDLGYVDDDGFLYLTGRRADLIKTGAHRVLPAAIEEAALELADVAEAAACGIPDPMLGQSVLLVVVPRRGANLTTAAVQAHCRKRLTRHMVPARVVIAGALPRTASGKVQRQTLPTVRSMEARPWAR